MGSCVCYTGVCLHQRTHLRTHSLQIAHICVYVYVCMCADMYICIYMHVCMYLYIYAFVHMCMCMRMRICAWIVGLGISDSACGWCHACACVFVCICMRMRMCVGIYICAFFCSECYMHFTGVLGTSAWVGEYHTGVFLHQRTHLRTHARFYTNVHICKHTLYPGTTPVMIKLNHSRSCPWV